MNLQPITGSKLNFEKQDPFALASSGAFGSSNMGGGFGGFGSSNFIDPSEKRRAGDLVSNLMDKQKEMKTSDPFALLKDLTTANAMTDKNST